jgi:gamma-glutamyltranspeptidase/glutathione hydrolase
VSAGNPYAVKIGMKVMENGGNAVDAAIAVSYALGVVQPYGSGIGGGGVMLVYPSDERKPVVYDYLGTAPSDGSMPAGYVGIPGFVMAMDTIGNEFGTMPLSDLIEPSVLLADKGFSIDSALNTIIFRSKDKLKASQPNIFYDSGIQPGTGMNLTQPELAATLKLIQDEGPTVFYKGKIARQILSSTKGLSASDLAGYKIIKREPVIGKYKDWDIVSAPPPFAGVTLIQILEMADKLNLGNYKSDSKSLYELYRIINTAYKDRIKHIADPDFVEIDAQEMVSPAHIDKLIEETKGSLSYIPSESEDTTHFVIIDKEGMMVSCSNSLSSWFGSGKSVAGFFLNNQLSNFNQNTYSVNQWEAGKRPRTFMSPTIVALDGNPILGIGTPGGNRISTVLSQIIISILGYGEDPQQAINAERFYLRSNILYYEGSMSKTTTADLNANGIRTVSDNVSINYGAVNCLYFESISGEIKGGADKRRGGSWESK